MKGATAEPWVSSTRLPNRAITSNSGSNQYFLRTRMKRQSSAAVFVISWSRRLDAGDREGPCGHRLPATAQQGLHCEEERDSAAHASSLDADLWGSAGEATVKRGFCRPFDLFTPN